MRLRHTFLASMLIAGALCASLALPMLPAKAQTPSNPAPYNTDLGAIITNALRVAGTVTSALQANTNWRGVICTYRQTASSASPSTTFSLQYYDAASATYRTMLTSGAIVTGSPTSLIIYPGIQTTGLPNNDVALNSHLPRGWRVSQTVGGSGTNPAVTSTIGCNYLL